MLRRTTLITMLLATLAVPFSAQAHPRERAGRYDDPVQPRPEPRPEVHVRGQLSVDNPNHQALEVRIDGDLVGTVPARGQVTFATGRSGRVVVQTRLIVPGQRRSEAIVDEVVVVGRWGVAAVRTPLLREGLLAVDNTWIEPLSVHVDGSCVGEVAAHNALVTRARTGALVEVFAPSGDRILSDRVSAAGLATQKLPVVPPELAWLEVRNPNSLPLRIVDAETGMALGLVGPGRTEGFQIRSGRAHLLATHHGRDVDTVALVASPWAPNRWRVQLPTTAPLTVTNDNPFASTVIIDGQARGMIGAWQQATFQGVAVGPVQITLIAARRGGTLEASALVAVDPLDGASVSPRFILRDGRGSGRGERQAWGRSRRGGWYAGR